MKSFLSLFLLSFIFSTHAYSQNTENSGATSRVAAVQASTINVFNCQNLFWSGTNLAWNKFAGDIGATTDIAYFKRFFADVKNAGGNSVRWWLHTNANVTPVLDNNGYCTGLGNNVVTQLNQVLDAAWEQGIGVDLCLFSFDMLQPNANNRERNKRFLTSAANLQSYVKNALTPMVNGVKNHPALLCWEIFNEPEGMTTEFGWTPTKIGMYDVQRAVNIITGGIHRLDAKHKVTNGCWAFKALCDNLKGSNERNYYTYARLKSAGGDALGTLDFYQVHYYDWAGTALSPFHHPKSYWGLDKELMVAEFFVKDTYGISGLDLYDNLYKNGYFGAWGWQYNESQYWNNIRPALQKFKNAHSNIVTVNKIACNGVTEVEEAITSEDKNIVVPNPFHDHFSLVGSGATNYTVYSLQGDVVDDGHFKGSADHLGGNLPAGVYYVNVSSENKNSFIKLLKQ